MKLIDKDALVAEIEKWKQHTLKCGYAGQGEYEEGNKQGRLDTCEKILSFIDTLEVKEVDFDAEWKRYFEYRGEMATVNVKYLAKHFFELGMTVSNKAQKGK